MQPTRMRGRVLIVAGSDSGGGAGIQADIKTVTALGAYAATAVTAVTVQNTLGVTAHPPDPARIVAAQIKAVLERHRRRRDQDRHAGLGRDHRNRVRRS